MFVYRRVYWLMGLNITCQQVRPPEKRIQEADLVGHLKHVRHLSSFLDARYLMAGKCYHHGRLGPCDDQLWDKTNYTVSIDMQLHGQVFEIVAFSFPASWEKSCMLMRSVASHWWSVHSLFTSRSSGLKNTEYIYIYAATLTFSAAVWFFFCRDLFPCHCNFFSCCMYKCRYFCIVRVEPQKGVTSFSESWDTTYCGPCLPIFKNISYNGKLQNLQKSSSWARIKYNGNFALNFAVWQQPLRFFKAEI